MRNPSTPVIFLIDYVEDKITLDGREIAPTSAIGADFGIETHDGFLGAVTLTIYAKNILIRHRGGDVESPTSRDAARFIVREGLADVLRWLNEEPGSHRAEEG